MFHINTEQWVSKQGDYAGKEYIIIDQLRGDTKRDLAIGLAITAVGIGYLTYTCIKNGAVEGMCAELRALDRLDLVHPEKNK